MKLENVSGRKPEGDGRQKNGADGGAGTSLKKLMMAETGQRLEPGILGRGTIRIPCLCCRVLVHLIRRTTPECANLMSARVRSIAGSNSFKD